MVHDAELKHILLLSHPEKHEMVNRALRRGDFPYQLHLLNELAEVNPSRFDFPTHAILVDFTAVRIPPAQFMDSYHELAPDLPLIILSEQDDQTVAEFLLERGAQDFVLYERLFRLRFALDNAINHGRERSQRFQAERLFATFMEQLEAAVFIRDEQNILRFANKFMVEKFGAKDWVNRTPFEHLPYHVAKAIFEEDRIVRQLGSLVGQTEVEQEDGSNHYFQTVKFVIKRASGPDWIGGIAVDITEQKLAHMKLVQEREALATRIEERTQELRSSNMELAHAVKLKDEFLAGVSHELRTPLNNVLLATQLLENGIYGELTPKQSRAINNISIGSNHLLNLVNDILDLARIESGHVELEIEKVDLKRLLATSRSLVLETAHHKGLKLLTKSESEVDHVYGDRRRLLQIMVNLLGNAIKFTRPGGEIGLSIESNVIDKSILFHVWDTGVGIEPDKIAALFLPFVRNDDDITKENEGTGLGLALVTKLVALHQGQVFVNSELGKGSRFTIALPWPEAPSGLEFNTGLDEAEEQYLLERYQDSTILIVDHDSQNRIAMADFCAAGGCTVITAANEAEALTLIERNTPDLVVLELPLPMENGLDALRQVRDHEDNRISATPVVVYSAQAMAGDEAYCLREGASAYFSKPVDLQEMKQVVMKLLGDRVN